MVNDDDELTEEQADAIYNGALDVNNARKEAAEMLLRTPLPPVRLRRIPGRGRRTMPNTL